MESNCGDDIDALTKRVVISKGPPRNDGTIQINVSAPKELNAKSLASLFIQRGTFIAPLKEYESEKSISSVLIGTEIELSKTIIALTYGEGGCRININVPAKV